ncbi:META domain-containing protein [Rhodobacter sp. SY28-1]|uniref:META domain-containing protein n=1 Tax=Rhodobacter sp. SY28-1 TaxID=2562317 RepID=UPI0010BFCF89|nr:META domain-containing protein [Rhodobacter sp. SY28-1]
MPRLSLAIAVALCPNFALACGPTPPVFDGDPETGVSISVGRIADRVWEPTWIDGVAVPDGAGLSLSVSFEGRVEGTTGCNRFTGTADLDAGTLQLGPLAVTEMACVEPDRMEREAAWLQALVEARGFVVSPAGLWLMREDGSVAACLE